MYRVRLDEVARRQLKRQARDRKTKPRTRERIEMVRLSDAGWSAGRIAAHLQVFVGTVRRWLKAYLRGGVDALADQRHPGPPSVLTPQVLAAVREHVRQQGAAGRTCTAGQLADWIAEQYGVRLSGAWLSRKLHTAGLSYQRTSRTLKHKQNAEEVAVKRAEKEALEKRGTQASWTWRSPTSSASR